MTLRYMDIKRYAKRTIIYDVFPYTTIKDIVSTQTILLTYDVASRNNYERLVLNAVSATLLKLQSIIRVKKFRRIHVHDLSVQLDINNINVISLVGTMIDYTVAVQ